MDVTSVHCTPVMRCGVLLQVSPEFSVRLMDETYSTDNETIARIQAIMVEYFKARNTPLARSGLQALQLSMAAIYYLPYLCGVNLFFRFSGQSIPNRCCRLGVGLGLGLGFELWGALLAATRWSVHAAHAVVLPD